MENLIHFLSSQNGKIICAVLLFIGVNDILIGKLVIGGIIKKLEYSNSPSMNTAKKIKNLQQVIKMLNVMGCAFIVFAIWGFTR